VDISVKRPPSTALLTGMRASDPLSVWERALPTLSLLSEWEQLHRHPADLRLLPDAGRGRGLHHADARHGGASQQRKNRSWI
jgi:hypothetical protein